MREDWTAVWMDSLTGGPEATDANEDASLASLSSNFPSLAVLVPRGSSKSRGLCQKWVASGSGGVPSFTGAFVPVQTQDTDTDTESR